jgi:hypothetical protein
MPGVVGVATKGFHEGIDAHREQRQPERGVRGQVGQGFLSGNAANAPGRLDGAQPGPAGGPVIGPSVYLRHVNLPISYYFDRNSA